MLMLIVQGRLTTWNKHIYIIIYIQVNNNAYGQPYARVNKWSFSIDLKLFIFSCSWYEVADRYTSVGQSEQMLCRHAEMSQTILVGVGVYTCPIVVLDSPMLSCWGF